MFTWICPKCGGEVPPSYDDCPHCAAKAKAAERPAAAVEPSAAAPVVPAPAPPPASAPAVREPKPEPLAPRRSRVSPALAGFLGGAAVVALLAAIYFWVLPRGNAGGADAKAAAPLERPGGPGTAQGAHPMAKHLEIAGVRVTEAQAGKVKVLMLVVNHSAADLPELKMDVTLRAGDREVFAFPAILPSTGPYESRELTLTVPTNLKPYELPDWQMIRPEFRLSQQP